MRIDETKSRPTKQKRRKIMIQNNWLVWAILAGWSGFSVWASNNTKIGKYLGFVNMGILGGLLFVNIGLMPSGHDAYKVVSNYFIPIGICLVLFMANLRELAKCGVKLVLTFVLTGAVMIMMGVVGCKLFNLGPEASKLGAVAISNLTGNLQTAAGTAVSIGISEETYAFFTAATAIVWVLYSIAAFLVGNTFVPKFLGSYKDSHAKFGFTKEENENALKEMSVTEYSVNISEVAIVIGAAVAIAGVGNWLGEVTGFYSIVFYAALGVLAANFTPIKKYKVNDHLATVIFTMYMITIGCSAHWSKLATMPWQMFLFIAWMFFGSLIVMTLFSKLFRLPWEYMLISHMACAGGPVATPPLAKSYGWTDLVLPGIVIAVLGQVFGAYCGLIGMTIANLF